MQTEKEITSIYNLYVDDLFTYGLYLGFDKEVVKDAIQDVFLKLYTDNRLVHTVKNTKFYLFRSLKNRLIDLHKYKREYVSLENVETTEELPFHIAVNVEQAFIENEEWEQIKDQLTQMLETLTDRQREAVYLRYVQEYNYEQTAELLGITVHSCRS